MALGTRQPLDGARQQLLKAVRDKGAPGEIAWIAVFLRAFPAMHLSEIGGELRLLEPSRRHIGMGNDDLTPGLDSGVGLSLSRCHGDPASLYMPAGAVYQTKKPKVTV